MPLYADVRVPLQRSYTSYLQKTEITRALASGEMVAARRDAPLTGVFAGLRFAEAMTERISTATARRRFAKILRDVARGKRIKLTRYNETLAGLISKRDLAELEDCDKKHGAPERQVRARSR